MYKFLKNFTSQQRLNLKIIYYAAETGEFAPPFLAVGEGFEPPIPLRVYRISNAAHSTALASHQTFEWAGFETTPFNHSGTSPFLVDLRGIEPRPLQCH